MRKKKFFGQKIKVSFIKKRIKKKLFSNRKKNFFFLIQNSIYRRNANIKKKMEKQTLNGPETLVQIFNFFKVY